MRAATVGTMMPIGRHVGVKFMIAMTLLGHHLTMDVIMILLERHQLQEL